MIFDRTWAEIDLKALQHNYFTIKSHLPDKCRFLGVVKTDAYGHGAIEIANKLQELSADYLAVACLDEALQLRSANITLPILILGFTPYKYTELLIANNITQSVGSLADAMEYHKQCIKLNKSLKIHLKIDTGMSRLGFLCDDYNFKKTLNEIIEISKLSDLFIEGIFTHFAVSDALGSDNEDFTYQQFKRFIRLNDNLKQNGIYIPIRHCANSGAVVNYPQMCLNMVRPGILLYGYGDNSALGLKPVMSLYSKVTSIKYLEENTFISYGRHYKTDKLSKIAVLAIGYGDGLNRLLSNKCCFYYQNHKIPQVGNICMDMCMVDVTDVSNIAVGDVIEIFGKNNSLEELSQICQTISYELLCNISKRVPRVYN